MSEINFVVVAESDEAMFDLAEFAQYSEENGLEVSNKQEVKLEGAMGSVDLASFVLGVATQSMPLVYNWLFNHRKQIEIEYKVGDTIVKKKGLSAQEVPTALDEMRFVKEASDYKLILK